MEGQKECLSIWHETHFEKQFFWGAPVPSGGINNSDEESKTDTDQDDSINSRKYENCIIEKNI